MERTKLENDLSERLHCLMIFIERNPNIDYECRKIIKSIARGQVYYNTEKNKLEYKKDYV